MSIESTSAKLNVFSGCLAFTVIVAVYSSVASEVLGPVCKERSHYEQLLRLESKASLQQCSPNQTSNVATEVKPYPSKDQVEHEQRELCAAAVSNDVVEVRKLLQKGYLDVNWRDSKNYEYSQGSSYFCVTNGTSLHIALLYNCDFELASLLVRYGADVNTKEDRFELTPLHIAAFRGNLDVVKLLVNRGSDVNAKENNGMTVGIWGAVSGNVEVVKFLANNGCDLAAKDESGINALMYTVSLGRLEMISLLLDEGYCSIDDTDDNGWTALFYAAWNRQTSIFKLLLDRGGSLDDVDIYGNDALLLAAADGSLDIVNVLLIDHDFDPTFTNYREQNAIMHAAQSGNPELVRFLIDWISYKQAGEVNHNHPLTTSSASNTSYNVVMELVDRWLEVIDARNADGETALIFAAIGGSAEVAGLLLDSGSLVDEANNIGWTALMHAAAHGHLKCVELLLDRDSSIDERSHPAGSTCNNCSALMIAAKHNHPDIVDLLLERGSNVDGCNNADPSFNNLCP